MNPRALSYTVDSDLGEGRGLSRTAHRLYSLARSLVRSFGLVVAIFFALVSFRFASLVSLLLSLTNQAHLVALIIPFRFTPPHDIQSYSSPSFLLFTLSSIFALFDFLPLTSQLYVYIQDICALEPFFLVSFS